MQTIFFFFYLRFQQEGFEDPCIASVDTESHQNSCVQEFVDWILLDDGLNYLVEVFDVLSRYSFRDVPHPVVAFSGLYLVKDLCDEDELIDRAGLRVEVELERSSGAGFLRIHFQRVALKASKS